MKRKPTISADAAKLRRLAEARLKAQQRKQKSAGGDQKSKADAQRLLHELQVHQIELELQNAELQQGRDELEAALEKYTGLYDFAPVGFLTLDPDGVIRGANLAGSRLVGAGRSALLNQHFGIFVSPADRPAFGAFLRKVFASKTRQGCEVRLQAGGRHTKDVEMQVIVFESRQACQVALMDITERKQAEEALRQSEEHYRLLFEANPNPMWVFDEDSLAFLKVNEAAVRHYGYSHEEFLAMTQQDIRPAEDMPRLLEAIERQHGQIVVSGGVWRHCKKDGTRIDVEVTVSTVTFQGKPARLVLANDVTARKRAEKVVGESFSLLEATLESTADGILVVDASGKITGHNKRFAELWQMPPEILDSGDDQKALNFVLNQLKNPEGFLAKVRELYAQPAAESFDILEFKNGRVFERYSKPQRVDRRAAGRVWSFRDITSRKQAEEEIKRLNESPERRVAERTTRLNETVQRLGKASAERHRAEMEAHALRHELSHIGRVLTVGELTAALAHELSQPLAAILFNAKAAQNLLGADPLDMPELRDIMHDIVADDERASHVIHHARAMLKKEPPKFQPLHLNHLIREVGSLLRPEALFKNTTVTLDLAAQLPPAWADRIQVQQVVLNLMMNGMDAMKDQAGEDSRLTVRTCRVDESTVQVSVEDTGPGIPAETFDQLFQPFVTTKSKGLCMGLYICRSVIQAHNGRLWGKNNKERGATFHFTLPVAEKGAS